MPLTHPTVHKIGCLVGLINTEYNGVSCLDQDTASDGEICLSGQARLLERPGYPKLLVFTGLVSGHAYSLCGDNNTNSIYVLNLDTLKPTQKSYRQIEIPDDLKDQIRTEMTEHTKESIATNDTTQQKSVKKNTEKKMMRLIESYFKT
tara:strand:- start:179 stop:622 length:444 start_codon:yes stop_codon:yes gene_type:complete